MKDMGVPSFKEAVHDLTYSKAKNCMGKIYLNILKIELTKN